MLLPATSVICALLIGQVDPIVQPWVAERFSVQQWRAPKEFGGRIYDYRLYEPPAVPEGERRPLLLWLHGEGEAGYDNFKHLRWLELLFEATQDNPGMFVLAWQHSPYRKGGWFGDDPPDEDPLSTTVRILDQIIARYPVDESRIYLAGVSSGGTACWELACRYPNRFAAVAPMASNGGDVARVKVLRDLPIWAFHSQVDRQPTPDGVRKMVEAVQRAGGHAWLCETEPYRLDPHNCWIAAFRDHRLTDWLLQQRRGERIVSPAANSEWPWWQGPAWCGVVVVLAAAWWQERKRRSGATELPQGEADRIATREPGVDHE